ncbi:MAG TPA: protein kinase [Polyangiaceae bacterium]|nr:protein kinase [Polyangiaceae bacterium]
MSGIEMEQAVAARRLGELIGRYRLERVLGAGGMAVVYAGRTPEGAVAAIKVLFTDMNVRRDVRERFYREGYLANSIQHPAVVRVLEHGETQDGVAYLAMELLEGETFAARAQRLGALGVAELLEVADQVLDALIIAHQQGIVHRDLKPDNLFLTRDGQVKVLDFGLARLLDALPQDRRTRSGVALGTLPYMPPEQALGRRAEVDARVDLFALGATLFRLHSGRRIHEAESDAELLMCMASKPAPPLSSVLPSAALGFCQIVDLALAFARDARYPDARTMQSDVRAVRAGQSPPFASQRLELRDQKTHQVPMAAEAPLGATFTSAAPLGLSALNGPGGRAGGGAPGSEPRLQVGGTVPIGLEAPQPFAAMPDPAQFGQTFRSTYAPPGASPVSPQRAPVIVEFVRPAQPAPNEGFGQTIPSATEGVVPHSPEPPQPRINPPSPAPPRDILGAETQLASTGWNAGVSAPSTSRTPPPPIWALLLLAAMAMGAFAALMVLVWWFLVAAGGPTASPPAPTAVPSVPTAHAPGANSGLGSSGSLQGGNVVNGPIVAPVNEGNSPGSPSATGPANPTGHSDVKAPRVPSSTPAPNVNQPAPSASPTDGRTDPDSRVLEDRGPFRNRQRD